MELNSLIPKIKYVVSDARIAWKALNGIFVVYKPPAVTYLNTRDNIIHHLCKGKKSCMNSCIIHIFPSYFLFSNLYASFYFALNVKNIRFNKNKSEFLFSIPYLFISIIKDKDGFLKELK